MPIPVIDTNSNIESDIIRISQSDLENLKTVLLNEGLPVKTIGIAPISFFAIVDENKQAIGWGGIEVYGNAGVMRSVVIKNELRGSGIGKKLVKFLIKEAMLLGLKNLWLLTLDAETFFAELGFKHSIRSEAPKIIQDCEEFTWSCNDTAHCMSLRLRSLNSAN